ncbi:hypothetical protein JANAI62_28460 [Jannaschia pagri]|uniref:Major facilitator superfamily (MFS) profile domain-containing protein n=2 Tax=Roseobacteraceae TaxID=2854170 RepID=A0ABQ4NP81_9RHOB|nr:hypothetical protein JANAI62_28460 [Jannaschia sp. AI_62]
MVARLWPGQDQMSLEARLASLPVGRQAALVGMALGALLAGAFVAATYGWIGILVYFGVVMLLVG